MSKNFVKTFAFVAVAAMAMQAQAFTGGSGTAADPYQIATAADLQEMSTALNTKTQHYEGKYFVQTADIDMSGVTNFLGLGCANSTTSPGTTWYFNGTYDGGGYSVKNLTIKGVYIDVNGVVATNGAALTSKSHNYIGFFGTLGAKAVVKNVNLDKSCYIAGYQYVGGITSYAIAGATIENCVNGATVVAYGGHAGGIIGMSMSNASAKTSVTGCVNYGEVVSGVANAGGIIGYSNSYPTTVDGCVNAGKVSAKTINSRNKTESTHITAGGILGLGNYSLVKNCANYGYVTAYDKVGGITGNSTGNASYGCGIYNCVNAGFIGINEGGTGTYVGAISGANVTTGFTYTGNYYDAKVADMKAARNTDIDGCTASTTAALTAGTAPEGFDASSWTFVANSYPVPTAVASNAKAVAAAAAYLNFTGETSATAFADTEYKPSTATVTFGDGTYLAATDGQVKIVNDPKVVVADTVKINNGDVERLYVIRYVPNFFEGTGTAEDPYLIKTKDDVAALVSAVGETGITYAGKYFKQTADIDLSEVSDFTGVGAEKKPFDGYYNGDGHVVKLNIQSTGSRVGYFGLIGEGATVANLTVEGSVSGSLYVAGVVAYADNGFVSIENCVNKAEVYATSQYAAGVVAYVGGNASTEEGNGTIKNCLNTGYVHCDGRQAAGIVSFSSASVDQCVNTGNVVSAGMSGGIAAQIYGSITNCVNAGMVKAMSANTSNGMGSAGGVGAYITSFSGRSNEFKNNISYTAPQAVTKSVCGVLYGTISTADYIQASTSIYDAQNMPLAIVKGAESTMAVGYTTSALTSGTLPEGFDSQIWTAEAGKYPMLTQYKEALADAASTYIVFAEGEKATDMKTTATVTPATATATVKAGTVFTVANGVITCAGGIATDTITIVNGAYTTEIPLASRTGNLVAQGDGSEENPYVISSVAEWNAVASYLENFNESYAGKYFKMSADLDFGGAEGTFMPMGNDAIAFNGVIDGDGHTISNVVYNAGANISSASKYVGVFRMAGADAVIKNMTVANSTISGYETVGGVVGYLEGEVENVKTDSTTKVLATNEYVGGIVGSASGAQITKCENAAYVGGSDGNTPSGAGGVAGEATNTTISECANVGTIESQYGGYIGGIVGAMKGKSITDSYNKGTISGSVYVGGIFGYCESTDTITVTNVYNAGTITATSMKGSIMGYAATPATVTNAYSDQAAAEGEVTTGVTYVATDQMNSGEVAYKLGEKFGQKIGTDAYPVLGGEKVYYNETTNTYYNESAKGDVNGDGKVDVSDVTYLINVILGNATSNAACDVNGDGNVDVSDVTALIALIVSE